jgi:putative FmdB family regulatory protein
MPIYRYTPAQAPCKLCGSGFDHRQGAAEAVLTECPTCGQPVNRVVVVSLHTPKLLAPLSVSAAKSAGFTVLKRLGKGEFEKQ